MVRGRWLGLGVALLAGCTETVVEVIPIATLSIEGLPANLLPGGNAQISVRALGSAGEVLTNRDVTLSSSNAGIATVSGTGVVTAVAPGAITINASAEGITANRDLTVNFPVPTITSLTPLALPAGTASTLTVRGTGFFPGSTVRVNGVSKTTTVISSTELRATISAGDFPTPTTTQITVFNPAPGGGSSAAQTVAVRPAACLVRTPFTIGTTVSGSLDGNTDCREGNFLTDYYSITSQQSQFVSVHMTSSQFDPSAVLTDSAGNTLAHRVAATTGLATFAFFGPARTYTLAASSGAANATGAYSLAVGAAATFDPAGCQDFFVVNAPGTTSLLNLSITAADCRIAATGGNHYSDRINIHMRAGQTVTVTMETTSGPGLDPFLIFCNADCSQRIVDNNSAGGTTARVTAQAQTTGLHFIDAGTAAPNQVGSYRITIAH